MDPLVEQTMTPYQYVTNNPVRYIDPTGMVPEDITLKGKNNSSVTVKTDLVNISLDVGSLGIDFGGNYTLAGNDVLEAALDIGGLVDQTGIIDGAAAVYHGKKGDWGNAIISGASVVPGGDLLKLVKAKKHIKTIEKAIEAVKNGNDVTVKTFKEADEVLFGAFPDAIKVKGSGNKPLDKTISQQKQFKGVDKNGKYHKDYKVNNDGVLYGHENLPDGHPHKTVPHINVKTPEGKKSTIYIKK